MSELAVPAQQRASQPIVTAQADSLSMRSTLIRLVLVGGAAALCTVAAWFVMHRVSMPSFNSSYVLRALSTAGSILITIVVAWICYAWVQGKHSSAAMRFVMQALGYLAPAGLVITTTAIPLAATHLYLDGISVDNEFRTQFLTRMADQLSHTDMAYLDMPSFYPGLWFFGGGALAKLTGLTGWAVFQPWALLTLAVSGSMLAVVWQRIYGSLPVGVALAVATTAVTLVMAPEEPYAAVVMMGMPAALILTRRALLGGRASLVASIIYLGLSANLYTLFTAISALSVVAIAALAAWDHRSARPLIRLLIMGLGSMVIAAIGWAPYLLALLTQEHGSTGTAQHYLPEAGTEIPTPYFDDPTIAIVSLIAVVWLVWRYRDGEARALTIGLLTCYAWVMLSMLMTLAGSTLLGFRVGGPIAVLLTAAGVIGIAQFRMDGLRKFYPDLGGVRESKLATRFMVVVLALACVSYTSLVPYKNEEKIDLAYTDSDGDAQRGDRMPADSTTYYKQIDHVLSSALGSQSGSIVLTDESNFMAYYPYHGYQAITSHYANPLGRYTERSAAIEQWTQMDDPQKLLDSMAQLERDKGFIQPDAMVLRGQVDVKESAKEILKLDPDKGEFPTTTGVGKDGFSYKIAEDVYPSNPNVRFRTVTFNPQAFAEGWKLTQVGPFVVAVREGAVG